MRNTIITWIAAAMIMAVMIPAAFAGSWSGTIVNAFNSTPIYNVTVNATLGSNSSIAYTDANGDFTVDGLLNGSYTLTYSAFGYVTKTRSGLPAINNSDPAKTDLVWPFDETLTPDGTVCAQSVSYGGWSACTGSQSRTATYTNYHDICGYRYITSESRSCDDGSGGGSDDSSGGGGSGSAGGGALTSDMYNCLENDVKVTPNDKVEFMYQGVNYTFFVKDILSDSVLFKLYPIPSRDVQVSEDEPKIIDLDRNSMNDFRMEVSNAFPNVEAEVSCRLINERQTTDDEEEEEEDDEPVLRNIKEGILNIASDIIPKQKASPVVGSILAIVIILIGLLGYHLYRRNKKDKDEFGF
ncbi:hypothetical protein GF345_01150 [Candidatus Woesearchaeota archaeon]|nr:hypothetical protein [Candidatus Woesearchaeota archaeon]